MRLPIVFSTLIVMCLVAAACSQQGRAQADGLERSNDWADTIPRNALLSSKEALAQFASDPLEFEPGTKMLYTSYGYIVLGCVIEGASATSYDRYMHQAISSLHGWQLPVSMMSSRLSKSAGERIWLCKP